MTVLNTANRLMLGGAQVAAAHLARYRVFPIPPAYLEPPMGQVTTPDLPADTLSSDVRFRMKLRLTNAAALTSTPMIAAQRNTGASQVGWQIDGITDGRVRWRWGTADGSAFAASPALVPTGWFTPGVDQYIGGRRENIGQGFHSEGETSTNGTTWTDTGVKADYATAPFFDSTAPITVGGPLSSGYIRWPGRIYWLQLDAIHQAWIDFAGQSSGIGVPFTTWPDPLEILTRVTISDPEATIATGTYPTIMGRRPTSTNDYDLMVRRGVGTRVFGVWWKDGAGTAQTLSGTWAANAIAADTPVWFRVRMTATTVDIHYSVANTFDPPAAADASWVQIATAARATAGIWNVNSGLSLRIGQTQASPTPWRGRSVRTIIRQQATGAVSVDMRQSNAWTGAAAGPTPGNFTAWSGQACSVAGTNPIVSRPDAVLWRFDASEWPAGAASFLDPRGRLWTPSDPAALSHPWSAPDSEVSVA